MTEKKFGSWTSSVDPSELSMRVKGALTSASAIVLWVVAYFGGALTPEGYMQQVSNISQLVFCAATAVGLLQSLYGFFRSLFVKKVSI